MTSTEGLPFTSRVWTVKLTRAQWTKDVEVTGTADVPRGCGHGDRVPLARRQRSVGGRPQGDVVDARAASAARITGTIGGHAIDLTRPGLRTGSRS